MIQRALSRHGGNLTRAAEELGVSRPTLYELMDKLGIPKKDWPRSSPREEFKRPHEPTQIIQDEALGLDHPDAAMNLNTLAKLYETQGKHEAAVGLYSRSLELRETTLGPNHPDVATILMNLAALYQAQSLYSQAEPLFRPLLEIFKEAFGPDHPTVATTLQNMALLYRKTGRHTAAEELDKRVAAIRQTPLFTGEDKEN